MPENLEYFGLRRPARALLIVQEPAFALQIKNLIVHPTRNKAHLVQLQRRLSN